MIKIPATKAVTKIILVTNKIIFFMTISLDVSRRPTVNRPAGLLWEVRADRFQPIQC